MTDDENLATVVKELRAKVLWLESQVRELMAWRNRREREQ